MTPDKDSPVQRQVVEQIADLRRKRYEEMQREQARQGDAECL